MTSDALTAPRIEAPRRRRAPWALAVPALLVASLVNLPLAYLFLRAAERDLPSYLEAVFSRPVGVLLLRTVAVTAGAVALSLVIAVTLAWLVVRTDLPGRRVWGLLAALPLVFPSYVAALSVVAVLGPRGYLQGWLAPLGVESLGQLAYGYSGALLSLSVFSYPYTYLLVVAALKGLDPALEESSVALGVSRFATFFRVVLPQLRPALAGGSLLVALYCLSDFGAVSLVRYNTFTLSIYNAYRALFDRSLAAALGTVLVLLTLLLLVLEGWIAGGSRPVRRRAARPAPPVALGRLKAPALAFVAAIAAVAVVMPVGMVGYWGVRAILTGNPLGSAGDVIGNSLLVSLAGALVAVACAIPVTVWAVRHPGGFSRCVERLCHAGYALPGLVVALSLVFLVSRAAPVLYQTALVLVAAYVIRFLPQALAATRSSLLQVTPRFEEAARSLGRTTPQVLRSITLPLVRPGLLAGGCLVFLTAMKELPATLLLRPTGFDTLATRIWTGAAEGIYSEAAVPALWLVLVSALPVYWLTIRPVLGDR
jgi:iron(III) transport system permease protein